MFRSKRKPLFVCPTGYGRGRRVLGLEFGGAKEPVGSKQRPGAGLGEDVGLGRVDQQQRRLDARERRAGATVARRAAVPHGVPARTAVRHPARAARPPASRPTSASPSPPPSPSPPSSPAAAAAATASANCLVLSALRAVRGTNVGCRLPGDTGGRTGRGGRGGGCGGGPSGRRSAAGRRTGRRHGRRLFGRELRLGH